MITVGAGRGGGKGLVAANSRSISRRSARNVVLVDADTWGEPSHASISPPARFERRSNLDQASSRRRAGLSLLPAAHDAAYGPSILRAGRKARWLAKLRTLPADYIVIDAGLRREFRRRFSCCGPRADRVTAPDPRAVEDHVPLLRAAYAGACACAPSRQFACISSSGRFGSARLPRRSISCARSARWIASCRARVERGAPHAALSRREPNAHARHLESAVG